MKQVKVNVVLERSLYEVVRRFARRRGIPVSQFLRDLIVSALEGIEDEVLVEKADARRKTLTPGEIRRSLKVIQSGLGSARRG